MIEEAKTLADWARDLADELRKLPSAVGALEDFCNARRGLAGEAALNPTLRWEEVLEVRGKAAMLGELLIICASAREPVDDQGEPEA